MGAFRQTLPASAFLRIRARDFARAGIAFAVAAALFCPSEFAAQLAPSVTVAPTAVVAGSVLIVTIAGAPGNVFDWVGLYPAGVANSDPIIDWKYLNGLRTPPAAGVPDSIVTFTAPMTAGTYDVRLFSNNSYNRLATSATITVAAAPSASVTVTVTPTSVNVGATITATIASGPANVFDWVGLYPASAANTDPIVDWKYLNGLRTAPASGMAGSTVTFEAPATAGTYDVRLFANNSYTRLATSATITVTVATVTPASVTVTPTTLGSGATIAATIASGPANVFDWVGLYPASAANTDPVVDWKYLNGLRTAPAAGMADGAVTFKAPATAGAYDVRLFTNNSYTRLATSATITVDSTPPVTSNVTVSGIAVSAATIGWTTDEASDSQVEYGLTPAYGSSSVLDAGRATAHWIIVTGLAEATVYHYRVLSRDGAGNLATSGDFTFTTLDGTPPSVSLSTPAANATVTGTVTVEADASDNVGVVGVQFKIDGANLGDEATAAPYSFPWHTQGLVELVFAAVETPAAPIESIAAGRGFTKRLSVSCPFCVSEDTVTEDLVRPAGSTAAIAATFTFSSPVPYLAQMAVFKASGTPVYVQGAAATSTDGGNTIGLTFPSNNTGGNLIVAVVSWGDLGTNPVSVTDSQDNIYLVATTDYDAANQTSLAILYAANVKDGANSVTAQFGSGSPMYLRLEIHEYSGIATTAPLDVTSMNVDYGPVVADAATTGSPVPVTSPVTVGPHILTAVARDAAGHQTTSAPVIVAVSDTTPPAPSGVAAFVTSTSATIVWTTNEASDSEVEYGPTTAYGSQSMLDFGLITAHVAMLDGLAPSTVYHYRARSRDAAGNLALSDDFTLTTLEGTPPTVSIVSPAAGSILSESATVMATASDNVGVTSVQFQLDGVPLGVAVSLSPYTITWDTSTITNGSHILTAVASDAAGNRTTSSAVSVTVSNVTAEVILSWDTNIEPILAGYKVYIGDSSGVYSQSVDVGNTTMYTVAGLKVGRLYYFAVTAYDQSGYESALSSEVSTTTAIEGAAQLVIPVSSWRGSIEDDVDLGFIEPAAAALRTLPGLRQLVFAERESARAAAGRLDHDAVAGGASRSDQMAQVVFDVAARQAELASER
jgi:hypothetical protein